MEMCSVIRKESEVEGGTLSSVSDKCLVSNDSFQSNDSLKYIQRNDMDESGINVVPNNDTNVCHHTNEVPLSVRKNQVDSITKSDCKEYSDCEDSACTTPVSSQNCKNSLPSKEMIHLNEVNNGVCGDSDSHSDLLCTEKVLLELTEHCDVSTVGCNSNVDIECEKETLSKSNDCCETSVPHTLTTDNTSGLCDVLSIKEEIETECNQNYDECGDLESKSCNEPETQFFDDPLKNEGSELSTQDSCEESQIVAGNSDSDTISADEGEKDEELNFGGNVDETYLSVKTDIHNQQILSNASLSSNKNIISTGPVLYQCTKCLFTDRRLEELTSHVLSCAKKRKQEQNQESLLNGEPQLKVHVLPHDQHKILPKSRFSTVSKIQPAILPKTQVPITPKTQFIIAPQPQIMASTQSQFTATPKTQIINAPKTQIAISPQAQLTGAAKTVFAFAPKLVSVSNPQIIINPQTQRPISSQPPAVLSVQNQPSPVMKPRISISPRTQMPSSSKVQSVITLQSQLPIVSAAQHMSVSKPQVVSSPQSQFSLAAGTKLTLGPHSQVPIVPQTPLTLSSQGLTIAQTGTQLLITTKPVQQNAGATSQPTLLGLGIGTNPAVAPKNIVLLPNVLLNSVSPSAGKVNGKQTPASIQGQFILQTATTPASVASVQMQPNLVYTSQSFPSQSQVLLSPLYTVPSNTVSTSVIKTTAPSMVLKPKSPLTMSSPKVAPNTTTVFASKTISKSVEQSGQTTRQIDKFICEICDDYVKNLEKLRHHMQCLHAINIHPKTMPSFNCQKCQYCFFTEQGLERHLIGSHGLVTTSMQEAADKGKDGGRCPICGWGYQSKLLHHVATDHKVCLKSADLSYKCTLCTATFGMYKQFEGHVYSVHRPAGSKLAQGNSQSSSTAIK